MKFLAAHFSRERVQIAELIEFDDRVYRVRPGSIEAAAITGLLALGVLESGDASWADDGELRFSTLAAKFLASLR